MPKVTEKKRGAIYPQTHYPIISITACKLTETYNILKIYVKMFGNLNFIDYTRTLVLFSYTMIMEKTLNYPVSSDAKFGVGGGIPLIIGGLKYGETNIYKEGAPTGLPVTGDVDAETMGLLLQKSNSGYGLQNHPLMGKSILAYNSKTNKIMLVVQGHNKRGMSLDQIRDYLFDLGYDNAISFDGSDSATLVQDQKVIISPAFTKNQTIPTGLTFSEKEETKE